MKDKVSVNYVYTWKNCILEDDNSLTFEEHDNYAGGVILSKNWKAYGERTKDCKPINYVKDVEELLNRYKKEDPEYYNKIQTMFKKNKYLLPEEDSFLVDDTELLSKFKALSKEQQIAVLNQIDNYIQS